MATEYIKLRGKVKWCKCYEPDEFNGATRWIVQFYPGSEEDWKKFKDSGLQMQPKEDKDGDGKFITIRRDTKKLIKDDLVLFSPPFIEGEVEVKYVDQNGKTCYSHNKGDGTIVSRDGDPVVIANGSEVVMDIAVYDTKMGKGHRWERMKVLTLEAMPEREEPVEDNVEDNPW